MNPTPVLNSSTSPPGRRFATDAARWAAVVERDDSAADAFVYGVKSTGICCRPGCRSRRPSRENVEFFDDFRAAQRAGFRACKRCAPAGAGVPEQQAAAVATACRLLEESDGAPVPVAQLAAAAGMSAAHFHRVFRQVAGVTPGDYAAAVRDARIRRELPRRGTVGEAVCEAGFASGSRFYSRSSAILGMRPRQFRDGGRGATIRFATGECSLGAILAASTDAGVCAILLGDDPAALTADLRCRFPRAQLVAGDRAYGQVVAAAIALVDDPARGLHLPLDIRGTAFQRMVWKALRAIPAGSTTTYSELAAALGKPSAARAVAGACAANPLAVAIPCHRVVRADGGQAGYRWGIERKRALLRREAEPAAARRP